MRINNVYCLRYHYNYAYQLGDIVFCIFSEMPDEMTLKEWFLNSTYKLRGITPKGWLASTLEYLDYTLDKGAQALSSGGTLKDKNGDMWYIEPMPIVDTKRSTNDHNK
jgi:hypothetical protein